MKSKDIVIGKVYVLYLDGRGHCPVRITGKKKKKPGEGRGWWWFGVNLATGYKIRWRGPQKVQRLCSDEEKEFLLQRQREKEAYRGGVW